MASSNKHRNRSRRVKKSERNRRRRTRQQSQKPLDRFTVRYATPETLQHAGPLVVGRWSLPASLQAQLVKEGKPIPGPIGGHMLVDTGASSTCIGLAVAQKELGLHPTSFRKTRGSGGIKTNPVFFVHFSLTIKQHESSKSGVSVSSDILATGIPDLEGSLGGSVNHQGKSVRIIGLLGRDFLRHTKLNYNGAGGTFELVIDESSFHVS